MKIMLDIKIKQVIDDIDHIHIEIYLGHRQNIGFNVFSLSAVYFSFTEMLGGLVLY